MTERLVIGHERCQIGSFFLALLPPLPLASAAPLPPSARSGSLTRTQVGAVARWLASAAPPFRRRPMFFHVFFIFFSNLSNGFSQTLIFAICRQHPATLVDRLSNFLGFRNEYF